jgi:hypothetical protein
MAIDNSIVGNVQQPKLPVGDSQSTGSLFGFDQSNKGAYGALSNNNTVNALGNGAMAYALGPKGGKTDYQKKSNIGNNAFSALTTGLNFIPGFGTGLSLALQGANFVGGKLMNSAHKLGLSETVGGASGYRGLASNVMTQIGDRNSYTNNGVVGKLFGNRHKMDVETTKLQGQQALASGIIRDSNQKLSAVGNNKSYLDSQLNMNFNNRDGINKVAIGKLGLNTEFLKQFKEYKNTPQNVIVDGKLHKELHHMDDIVDADITRKGVPVVEMEEGGQLGSQRAEVERDEIILHLQLTKKLEDLSKEGTDEDMVKAGKLLTTEILKNTKDSKTKLLKTVE